MSMARFGGRPRVVGVAVLGVAVAATLLAATPAQARIPVGQPLGVRAGAHGHLPSHGYAPRPGRSSVTVQLAPSHPAALTALSTATGLSTPARRSALSAAAPSSGTASAV